VSGGWPREQEEKGKYWEQGGGPVLCGCWVQALGLLVEGEEGKGRRGKILGSGLVVVSGRFVLMGECGMKKVG